MSKDENLIEEKESWWCKKCKNTTDFMGDYIGIACCCDEPVHVLEEIPDKWVECKARVTKVDWIFSGR